MRAIAATAAARRSPAQDCLAVVVIPRALLRVAQDFPRGLHVLEHLLRLLGTAVLVGVPPQGRPAVRTLQRVRVGARLAAEHLIVAPHGARSVHRASPAARGWVGGGRRAGAAPCGATPPAHARSRRRRTGTAAEAIEQTLSI